MLNNDKKIRDLTRELTAAYLHIDILNYQKNVKEGSFTMPELLGSKWDFKYLPFYGLYGQKDRIAANEMGKLIKRVCESMNLDSRKENRRGKENAITRYFFKKITN